jgi:hypothetical protein
MTMEQQLRDHYESTTEVLGGPDLGSVLDGGRRRRRVRMTGAISTAAAAVTVGAVVAASLVGGDSSPTASDPARGSQAAAAPTDHVPGTQIDETMQSVIAEHLPGIGAATDVYPSDWDHSGPMPDADFADATDWQAAYDLTDAERALVVMGYPMPGEPTRCPSCHEETVPEGTLLTQVSYVEGTGEWHFFTSLVRDDGFSVSVIDYVVAPEEADARQARSISNAEAAAVVRDPRLQFPMPEGR